MARPNPEPFTSLVVDRVVGHCDSGLFQRSNIRAGYEVRAAYKVSRKEAKRQAKMRAEWETINNSEAEIIDPDCTVEQRDKAP